MYKHLRTGIFLPGTDEEFIQWCQRHPDGFVWNCVRDQADMIWPFMLHASLYEGHLCPHFRNATHVSGYESNLTCHRRCKNTQIAN
jgi:hypothetical protein